MTIQIKTSEINNLFQGECGNLFEKEKELICVPCYSDTQLDLNRILNNELKDLNIKLF